MTLSKEKSEEIAKKIEEVIKKKTRQPGFKCPICTNTTFSLAGGFTNHFLMDTFGGDLVIGGPVLPSVPIVCTNCGNTLFLNAKVLGLNEEIPKEENKKGDGK